MATRDDMAEDATEYRQFRFRAPAGATDLLLIRHGESVPAPPGRARAARRRPGRPGTGPRGHREAALVAARLADEGIAAIYVTSLRRTAQTAAPLAAITGRTPQVERDLREVHLGDWEGAMFNKRLVEHDPRARQMGREQRWDVLPGAEPTDVLHKRVRGAIGLQPLT